LNWFPASPNAGGGNRTENSRYDRGFDAFGDGSMLNIVATRLLKEYVRYYHEDRGGTLLALNSKTPGRAWPLVGHPPASGFLTGSSLSPIFSCVWKIPNFLPDQAAYPNSWL